MVKIFHEQPCGVRSLSWNVYDLLGFDVWHRHKELIDQLFCLHAPSQHTSPSAARHIEASTTTTKTTKADDRDYGDPEDDCKSTSRKLLI